MSSQPKEPTNAEGVEVSYVISTTEFHRCRGRSGCFSHFARMEEIIDVAAHPSRDFLIV